jgi:hypothetical protein
MMLVGLWVIVGLLFVTIGNGGVDGNIAAESWQFVGLGGYLLVQSFPAMSMWLAVDYIDSRKLIASVSAFVSVFYLYSAVTYQPAQALSPGMNSSIVEFNIALTVVLAAFAVLMSPPVSVRLERALSNAGVSV